MPDTPHLHAQHLASLLPPLLVAAERAAASVAAGMHGRRRAGPGETFWQFRTHQPHDAASTIDWRQSARSSRIFVRENEWAAAQTLGLWADGSPSMAWRSSPHLPEKRDRARVLALALASLALRGGERVKILGSDHPSGSLEHMGMAMLSAPDSPPPCRQAQVVLFSDFLNPLDQTSATVRAMDSSGHLVMILDPAEETLPFTGKIRFAGLEDEGETLINRAEDIRPAYAARLTAHREALAALAAAKGWSFALHHTDQPPQTLLLALHARLSGGRA